jgi:Na+-transporting NADH:ubiquinone oxidoreductase subunit F
LDLAFFIAPLAVSGISAALAAIISISDRILNNYGDVVIGINHGKKDVTLSGGAPLLISLSESGIFVPSACGGRGSCGACKVKITSDIGPHLPTEIPYLTKQEIAENVHLSCQVKLKQNIDIEIPESLFNVRQYDGVVEKIVDVTHDIKEVLVRLPEGSEVNFSSGQYGQIEVPPYDKIKEPTQRAYSMSSASSKKGYLEFLVRLVPGGIVTTYVHQNLQEGQRMKVIAPFGEFMVKETDAAMICVAGGSGMAPFKSIFQDRIDRGVMDERDIWYFFGARTKKDLFYLDWLEELQATYSRFHFVAALSEPQPEDDWKGETGLITDVLAKYLTGDIPKEQTKEGYLCGSPGMLDACMNVMRKYDMVDDKIFFDKFA